MTSHLMSPGDFCANAVNAPCEKTSKKAALRRLSFSTHIRWRCRLVGTNSKVLSPFEVLLRKFKSAETREREVEVKDWTRSVSRFGRVRKRGEDKVWRKKSFFSASRSLAYLLFIDSFVFAIKDRQKSWVRGKKRFPGEKYSRDKISEKLFLF